MERVDRFPNIPSAFFDYAERSPERVVYAQRSPAGSPHPSLPAATETVRRTYREVAHRVVALTAALRSAGVEKGHAVALLSNTRPEWMEADLAILAAGAVSVSVYQSLPAADVGYILFDSGAQYVFAENAEQVEKLLILSQSPCAIPATEDRPASAAQLTFRRIFTFEPVEPHPLVVYIGEIFSGIDLHRRSFPDFDLTPTDANDLAALVYTSGTTGPPKGVMQTHRNHLANVRQAVECGLAREGASIMLFLPLAHSFAKLMGYIGFLTGVELRFPTQIDQRSSRADPVAILRDIREHSAEMVPVVPRFLEKMRDGIELQARDRTVRGWLLRLTIWGALSQYRAERAGRQPAMMARAVFRGTSAVREAVREKLFGKAFRQAISGGAKLPIDVAIFFDALGIEVCEGYGLTETCVATNVNRLGQQRIGTVGPVLAPDIELRLSGEGEVLFRGPNITQGYLNRPSATAKSWDAEGWFHTGDVGSLDADGFLSIVGRIKELLVTSGGKKIAPQSIEDRLKAIAGVSQALLVGDGKPFCVALLTLDRAALISLGRFAIATAEGPWNADGSVRNYLWKEVEQVNGSLSSFETVKNILILADDFTVENGLLTPTLKVKRSNVLERYQKEIAELYVRTARPV